MKMLFLGGFIPSILEDKVRTLTKNSFQSAANNFQHNLIKGFRANHVQIDLMTAMFIGSYPKFYKKVKVDENVFYENDYSGISVAFTNIAIIKNISKYLSIYKKLREKVLNNELDTIIIYTLNLPYIQAAIKLKEDFPFVQICLIITDLPEFPGDSSSFYKLYLNKIEKPRVYRLLHKVDKFVLLTEAMSVKLSVAKDKFIVIEGLSSNTIVNDFCDEYTTLFDDCKTILYTGSLDLRYGLKELLDSFCLIDDVGIRLVICGSGPGLSYLKECQKSDNRIHYLGLIPFSKIQYFQKKATLLINPRSNSGEYNKFSFPSKTMEYLASGTPVLMHKLDGVPKEYDKYLYYFIDESIFGMRDSIIKCLSFSEEKRNSDGQFGREFVLREKNAMVQVKKILDFLNKK